MLHQHFDPKCALAALCLSLLLGLGASAQTAALSSDGPYVMGASTTWTLQSSDTPGAAFVAGFAIADGPPVAIDQRMLYLNPGPLLQYCLAGNIPELFGTLDSQGAASFALPIPFNAAAAGLPIHGAFVTVDPSAPVGIGAISNTIRRTFQAIQPNFNWTALDSALDGLNLPPFSPGLGFILVKDGEVIYERYRGNLGPLSRVSWASASKWPSALAILDLVDEGLIDLDAPISTWLPMFTGLSGTITVRQCFSHTSGLPSGHPCLDDTSITLANCVAQIAAEPLIANPGTTFAYGGPSMMVAARVAEIVTGQSWNDLFDQRIAQPLGATSLAYDWQGVTLNPRVSGGAKGTTRDYAKVLLSLLDGGAVGGVSILSTEAQRIQTLNAARGLTITTTPSSSTGFAGYGQGVWIESESPAGAATLVSSPGAFGAYPWVDLERGYGAFLLVRATTPYSVAAMPALRAAIESVLPRELILP